jgi:DNA-directed RNA polymerase subunit M/transcription elongation factor TFIIS
LQKTRIVQGFIGFAAGSQRIEYMTLVVKCRGCGYVFPSMVQIDQLEYGKTAILEDRTETCPKCGKISTYSTEDYWFQS